MKEVAEAFCRGNGKGDGRPANQAGVDWVNEIAALTKPGNIFWCDGSERANEFLIAESLKQNVLIALNQETGPHSYLHRSNPNDVARVAQFTFVCTPTQEQPCPPHNRPDPPEPYTQLPPLF